MLHAARGKYRTQNVANNRHLDNIAQFLSGYIFATKARIDNQKKNMLSSNISSICRHKMVNFGPVAAEMGRVV